MVSTPEPRWRVYLGDASTLITLGTAALGLFGILQQFYTPDWNFWIAQISYLVLTASLAILVSRLALESGRFAGLYETLQRHVTYKVDASDVRYHTYTISMKVRSRVDGLQSINLKFLWTGHGSPSAKVTSSNGRASVQWSPFSTLERLQYYNVCFERPLMKREIVLFEVVHSLFDEDRSFIPQLSMSPNRAIKDLKMQIVLPDSVNASKIRAERIRGSIFTSNRQRANAIPVESNVAAGVHSVNLSKIRGGRTAVLYWDWNY